MSHAGYFMVVDTCQLLIAFATGFAAGAWYLERKTRQAVLGAKRAVLKGQRGNATYYQYRIPRTVNGGAGGGGDKLTGDDRQDAKQTGKLENLKPGDLL